MPTVPCAAWAYLPASSPVVPGNPLRSMSPGAPSRSSRRRGDRRGRPGAGCAAPPRLAQPRRVRRAAGRLRDGTGPAVARAPARALGAAPDRATAAARSLSILCTVRAADGRWLAGRRAAVAGLVGRALGARRRRLGRGRREPGRHHAPRAARGVVGRARAACGSRRCSCCPSEMVLLVGQAWLADGATVTPTTSTTSSPGGRPTRRAGRARPTTRCADVAALVSG